jgi:hypothetical protein
MDTERFDLDGVEVPEVAPVELTALDPTARADHFDSAVSHVLDGARFELARRRKAAIGMGATLLQWGRVAWPAAAAVALASLAVLRTEAPVMGATPDAITIEEEMALAVGVPEALAPWVSESGAPGLGEILIGWEEEER